MAQECSSSEVGKILAGDGTANDGFGFRVAVSGDVAIVGAPNDEGGVQGFAGTGSAYVYRFDGTQWNEEAKFQPAPDDGVATFGTSIGIDGDLAIVGTALHGDTFTGTGSVYVYRFDGKGWFEETVLIASDAAVSDNFGFACAISGETIVVGAREDNDNGTASGSAYVYTYDNLLSIWDEEKLTASDGDSFDEFGFSVAIDGTMIAVGAFHDEDGAGTDAGSAYVFEYDGTSWAETAKFLASDGAANDQFGFSVGVDDGVAVVGANRAQANAFLSGAAYVYRNSGAGWGEAKLFASDGDLLDSLGESVSISGDSVLAGAPFENESASGAGAAYLFRYDGSAWSQDAKLLASDGDNNDFLGGAVALSGDAAFIGAAFENENGDLAGAAYVFDLGCGDVCIADTTGDGVLDIFDVFAFLDLFNGGDLAADITGDGSLDIFDVFAFLDAFNEGCP